MRGWALAHEAKNNPKTIHVGHRGEYERDCAYVSNDSSVYPTFLESSASVVEGAHVRESSVPLMWAKTLTERIQNLPDLSDFLSLDFCDNHSLYRTNTLFEDKGALMDTLDDLDHVVLRMLNIKI